MKPQKSDNYHQLLSDIKARVRSAQYEALKAVNKELIALYWDIGTMIVSRQKGNSWGKSVVQRLAKDLQLEFPGIGGFSASNLWRMRDFYCAYADDLPPILVVIRSGVSVHYPLFVPLF